MKAYLFIKKALRAPSITPLLSLVKINNFSKASLQSSSGMTSRIRCSIMTVKNLKKATTLSEYSFPAFLSNINKLLYLPR